MDSKLAAESHLKEQLVQGEFELELMQVALTSHPLFVEETLPNLRANPKLD